MKETPQQYIRRILGYQQGRSPFAVQRATPARLERLLRGLSRAQLRRRPAPGKWSINEIVAHLADTELVGGYRLRMILSKNGTPIQAFDQDVWARIGNYNRVDSRMALEMFRALRAANLRLIRSLGPKQLRYYGMHAERGKESVMRLIRLYAGHDLNHLRQIEAIRRSFRAR
jgi:uncharacterized damage-inducible protein DinB